MSGQCPGDAATRLERPLGALSCKSACVSLADKGPPNDWVGQEMNAVTPSFNLIELAGRNKARDDGKTG